MDRGDTIMGYYTDYILEHDTPDDDLDIKETLLKDAIWRADVDDLMDTGMSAKWYKHEEEMLRLSYAFPNTVFILHGEGEEQGDVWKKRFINNTVETVRARVYMEDFEDLPEEL
jgi:hypothetical protein